MAVSKHCLEILQMISKHCQLEKQQAFGEKLLNNNKFEQNTIDMLFYLFSPLHHHTIRQLSTDDHGTRLNMFVDYLIKSHDTPDLRYSMLLASLLNKLDNDSPLFSKILAHASLDNLEQMKTLHGAQVYGYYTKALFLSGYHPLASTCLKNICALVTSGNEKIASFFSVLMQLKKDDESTADNQQWEITEITTDNDILCESFGIEKPPFFEQRCFALMLPILLNDFKAKKAQKMENGAHLIAISAGLAKIPRAVMLNKIPSLVGIVLEGLTLSSSSSSSSSCSSSSSSIIEPCLYTVELMIDEAKPIFIEHLSSFIPKLIALTSYTASMKIRIRSLQVLERCTQLPFHEIYPFTQTITSHLQHCLDDRKRLVRQAAVACRNAWFLLNSSE